MLAFQAGTHERLACITLQALCLRICIAALHAFMLGVGQGIGWRQRSEGQTGSQDGQNALQCELSRKVRGSAAPILLMSYFYVKQVI